MLLSLCLVCAAPSGAQQEDIPYVESPHDTDDEGSTRLEDQPDVEPLPDWLIDIPPSAEDATQDSGARRVLQEFVQADEHVVSQSRMFSVSGGDALRMGAIAAHADELRSLLNKLLELDNKWKYAISIRLLGNTADAARANPIRTRVRIIGKEPNLQIRIFAGGGINITRLDEAIITMLLYEYALRDIQPDALPDYLQMPPWLITGIRQAVLWRQGRADRRLYQNLFNRGDMLSPEQIVSMPSPERLDASSRQLFEVSCGVLVMGLLHQKEGADQLRNLLAEALTQEGSPKDVIATHFHGLDADGNSFSKWWALELASLSAPQMVETLTPIESEKRLSEALLVTGVNKDTRVAYSLSMADVDELLKLPDWQMQIRTCADRLAELNLRCFPGYRAIIAEYIRAIGELASSAKPENVKRILEPLAELRQAYSDASLRGRDYLDWYEITHLGHAQQQNFDNYTETMRLLRRDTPGPTTPISQYLDDIETLYSLDEGEALPKHLRPAPPKRKP